MDKIKELEAKFDAPPEFFHIRRQLISQGSLMKKCLMKTEKYYFFLFNDLLAYATWTAAGKFHLHRKLPIDLSFGVVDLGNDNGEFRFQIQSGIKNITVIGKTMQEKQAWMEDLRRVIAENYAKLGAENKDTNGGVVRSDTEKSLGGPKPGPPPSFVRSQTAPRPAPAPAPAPAFANKVPPPPRPGPPPVQAAAPVASAGPPPPRPGPPPVANRGPGGPPPVGAYSGPKIANRGPAMPPPAPAASASSGPTRAPPPPVPAQNNDGNKVCPKCGASGKFKFCSQCGTKVQ